MATKIRRPGNSKIAAKARQVLEFAREKAPSCHYSNELFNAIFSVTGKATVLFPSESERSAYTRTPESKEVYKLINMLPRPPITEVIDFGSNGDHAVKVSMPKSVHAALLTEAAAEGVTVEQLCLSKLVAQLRDLV